MKIRVTGIASVDGKTVHNGTAEVTWGSEIKTDGAIIEILELADNTDIEE